MEEPVECTISEVCMKNEQEGKLQPILVTFQHGTLRSKEACNLRCRVARDKKSKKRVFSVTTGLTNVVYSGSEQSDSKTIGRTMIAIRNRKTNQVRLIEADNVLLSPFIKEQKKSRKKSKLNANDKFALLQKSFGSKTVKRRTEQMERSKTDVSMLTEKLIQAVANVDVKVMAPEDPAAKMLVPCNRKASVVEDVYKLYDIITKEELHSMQDKAKQVIANANSLEKSQYTSFFLEHLPTILAKSENQLESLEVLLFIDCLMKFFSSPFKKSVTIQNTCPYSRTITQKICNEYTMESTSNKRLRPLKMKEKAVCHMIVLSLLILDYKLDLLSIVASAKESIVKVQQLSRALGASTTAASKESIVLKLPLAESSVPMGPRGKKSRK